MLLKRHMFLWKAAKKRGEVTVTAEASFSPYPHPTPGTIAPIHQPWRLFAKPEGGACRDSKEASYMSKTIAILIARLIFGGIFVMAAASKFSGMEATANHIAEAGFPFPLPLAWVAAVFETLIAIALLTGAYFREAALLAAIYVLFLAFALDRKSVV